MLSANVSTGHAKCRGALHPSGVQEVLENHYQGLHSLHSLNPWLISIHASDVTRRIRSAILVRMRFVLAALMAAAIQQVPQDRPGSIEGTVMVAGAVPTPIAGARIEVTAAPTFEPSATRITFKGTTDGAGRFVFPEVPPGQYAVEARHDGYGFWTSMNMNRVRSAFVTVVPGQPLRVPPFSMLAAATIRGRVIGPDGKGVPDTGVEFLRLTNDEDGQKIWTRVGGAVLTGDDGKYQSTMLGPGEYYVRTMMESGALHIPVYYPETTEGDSAAPIVLTEGSERTADIRLRATPSSDTYKISGRVIRPPSEPGRSGFVELVLLKSNAGGPIEESASPVSRAEMVLMKRGDNASTADEFRQNFEFRGIPRGRYNLVANANIDGGEYSSIAAIDIRDEDVEKVDLPLRPVVAVRGRVVIEGPLPGVNVWGLSMGRSRPEPGDLKLTLQRKDRLPVGIVGPGAPHVDADGKAFSFVDVPEGHYDIVATIESNGADAGRDFYVADVRAAGRSVLTSGLQVGVDAVDSLEVVLGTDGGAIEGKLTGSTSGLPAALILLPDPFRRGTPTFYRVLYRPRNGTFEMKGIPPGTYKLFAVPYVNQTVPYRSAEFIARYESRAVTVTVQKQITLRGVEVPYLAR
jgi:hypothetical protein